MNQIIHDFYVQPMQQVYLEAAGMYLLWTIAMLLLRGKAKRFVARIGVLLAVALILVFTLWRRSKGEAAELLLTPFVSFAKAQTQPEYYRTMFMNILLFVFFVLLMFSRQKDENARILQLNWVLSYKNDQLRRANIKLKEYSETIRHMTETEERNRLAREIHDTLGHTLTGIVVSADAGKILMDAAPEEARKRFDVIADTARQGLEDVRRSIRALRPDALDRNGLWKALEIMVSDFHNSTGAVIVYEQNAGDPALASDEEDAVYRIVQEGLTNAIRHGQATRIFLSIGKQEEYLRIRITDNGTGVREQKEGFGLNHMRERLEMLKGELKFGNRDDGESGACLEAVIPVRDTRPEVEE